MKHWSEPMTFGALIHQLREERGWTQDQLARTAGITVGSVSNLERGVTVLPNAETVERLAAAFDLEPEELDARWLAERVIEQARTLARRQAVKGVLEMDDRQLKKLLIQLGHGGRRKPRRRKRR